VYLLLLNKERPEHRIAGAYENRFLFASPTRSATVWQFINSMQHMPGGITSVSLESSEIDPYLLQSSN
jgi:hypothetical protein